MEVEEGMFVELVDLYNETAAFGVVLKVQDGIAVVREADFDDFYPDRPKFAEDAAIYDVPVEDFGELQTDDFIFDGEQVCQIAFEAVNEDGEAPYCREE